MGSPSNNDLRDAFLKQGLIIGALNDFIKENRETNEFAYERYIDKAWVYTAGSNDVRFSDRIESQRLIIDGLYNIVLHTRQKAKPNFLQRLLKCIKGDK